MIQTKLVRRTLALAVGATLAVGSQFAIAASQQLDGKATILPRDIATQYTYILNFGEVRVGTSGGTVSISNDNSSTQTVSGDVTSVSSGSEGILGIQGEKNETVVVSLDSSFILNPTTNPDAASLTVALAGQGDTLTLTADNGTWNYYQIGGTLSIPANQPADTYVGSYNATVNYQ